jgi:hypothetical protein
MTVPNRAMDELSIGRVIGEEMMVERTLGKMSED